MRLSDQINPISYLKAHVLEILWKLQEQQEPLIITLNDEAKEVFQDVRDSAQS